MCSLKYMYVKKKKKKLLLLLLNVQKTKLQSHLKCQYSLILTRIN